jgi:hypothetical protein
VATGSRIEGKERLQTAQTGDGVASLKKKIEGFVHSKQLEHKTWQGLEAFKLKALPEVFAKTSMVQTLQCSLKVTYAKIATTRNSKTTCTKIKQASSTKSIYPNLIGHPDTSLPLHVSLVIQETADVKEGLAVHADHHR